MSTSPGDEESNLTAAFEAAAINATHRRSSTQVTSDTEEDARVETVVENNNTAPEPASEPENPASNVNTRPRRRRKQTTPRSRLQAFAREVRKLQMSPNFMIPRLNFGRVVREILLTHCDPPLRVTLDALEALQTATEMYLTQRFQDAYLLTIHRGRVTLENRDMALMAFICQQFGHL